MSFVEEWWEERREEARAELRRLTAPEEGHPARYDTTTSPTDHPWSAVLGAKERLPRQISLRNLRASLGRALAKSDPRVARALGLEVT